MIEKYLYENESYQILEQYPGFIITSTGRIFQIRHNTIEEVHSLIFNGHKYVILTNTESIQHKYYVHDLVFLAFKGVFDQRFFKIIHKNKNILDNSIENLRLKFRRTDESFIKKYEDAINELLDNRL